MIPSNNPYLDNIRAGRIGPVEQGILARVPGSMPEMNAPEATGAVPAASAAEPRPIAPIAKNVGGIAPPAAAEGGAAVSSAIAAPKPKSQAQQWLDDPNNQKSGIGKIKSPWARIPLQIADAIGTAFLPGVTMNLPGTELHHRILENRARGAVNEEAKRDLESAQAEHARAEAGKITHPPVEYGPPVATDQGLVRPEKAGPGGVPFMVNGQQAQSPDKTEAASRTITTDQGVMQWNPETNRYDIKAGNAPGSKGGHIEQDQDGAFYVVHDDGTATPVTANGEPLMGGQKGQQNKDDRYIALLQKDFENQGLTPDAAYKKAYQKYTNEVKVQPGVQRAMVFVNGRLVPALDTANGNAPSFPTVGDIKTHPGQYMPPGPGAAALTPTALIEDLRGGANQVRQMLQTMPELSAMDKAKIALVFSHRDPKSALDSMIASGAIGSMSPEVQQYMIYATNLMENAMSLRSVLKAGQGAEDVRAAILATIPGPTTPNNAYALKQLKTFEATLDRVSRGIPKVTLRGEEPSGGGNATVDDLVKKYGGR